MGRLDLAQGEREAAFQHFQEGIRLAEADDDLIARALSGIEGSCSDRDAFLAFCGRLRQARPDLANSPFTQWFLEPVEREARRDIARGASVAGSVDGWRWIDPLEDCAYRHEKGLTIFAANGRDLWHVNHSAPRLLRPVSEEFVVETASRPATNDRPTIGGLCLWKDAANWLRLDRGTRGPHEISFSGRIAGDDQILGRGALPSERIFLRLERSGRRVRALCSADARNWFTAGEVLFPVDDPIKVGVHAIGAIDRLVYPGAYPDGTAIHFETVEIWSA